jgi:hypothetical protein
MGPACRGSFQPNQRCFLGRDHEIDRQALPHVYSWRIGGDSAVSTKSKHASLAHVLPSQIVQNHLDKCSSITADRIKDCVALEYDDPFTSNGRDLAQYQAKFVRLYTAARRKHTRTMSGRDDGLLATIMQQLQAMNVDKEAIARLLVPDKADEAIDIIAEVRAYYQRMCPL